MKKRRVWPTIASVLSYVLFFFWACIIARDLLAIWGFAGFIAGFLFSPLLMLYSFFELLINGRIGALIFWLIYAAIMALLFIKGKD